MNARQLNLTNSNNKKIRGLKRKCKNMVHNINYYSSAFPDKEWDYWHVHAPIAQSFIDWNKTPKKVKKLFIQSFISAVQNLIKMKPNDDTSKVVFILDYKNLFHSQLDVFFDLDYYNDFFDRNNEYQRWILLPEKRNIVKELNLNILKNIKIRWYKQIINDDWDIYESELWFFWEL